MALQVALSVVGLPVGLPVALPVKIWRLDHQVKLCLCRKVVLRPSCAHLNTDPNLNHDLNPDPGAHRNLNTNPIPTPTSMFPYPLFFRVRDGFDGDAGSATDGQPDAAEHGKFNSRFACAGV